MLPPVVLLLAILAFASATPDPVPLILADKDLPNEPYFKDPPEDATLNAMQLAEKYHYNPERHTVVTEDGYILEMHRLRGRTATSDDEKKPVAFVMHGLLASSAAWVLSGPEKSLGFILADAGYDVWLGNSRGSFYSRNHTKSGITEEEYWTFSWHEIGVKDLPAMIDHILKTTGQEKLFYLGHSQGTTTFFVMTTMLPEYQDKIQAMFALAPVTYSSRMTNPLAQLLARISKKITLITKLIGMYEFAPTSEAMKEFAQMLCSDEAITQPICSNIFFLFGGYDKDQMNTTLLPVILGHVPAGACVKQVIHYAQLVKSGKFRQYDYGFFRNLEIYNRIAPPKYDLRKVKVPIALHYSTNDWLSSVRDVDQLYKELPNPIGKFRVPHEKFNHLDYMWAKDVDTLLYNKVLSLMSRYKD